MTDEQGAPDPPDESVPMTGDLTREWLEADGLGGFASGTVPGLRTRRYHALLLTARRPPTDRFVLVNGFDAWVETAAGRFAISSQAYAPGVVSPDGAARLEAFALDPWPIWTFELEDGTRITQELFVARGSSVAALSWRAVRPDGAGPATLEVRPFLSGRDSHALHHENSAFRFDAEPDAAGFVHFRPYAEVPAIAFRSSGVYTHAPDWYRNFLYAIEAARGLDATEDLGSPGTFRFALNDVDGEAILLMAAEGHDGALAGDSAQDALATLRRAERRRRKGLGSRLERSADAYLVRRGAGRTIVAGYPWFTDWGRDTFIAMRGLCLATGRLAEAGQILVEWSTAVSEGMLPNFFPDFGAAPEFNAVDASLWFCIAVHEYLSACAAAGKTVARGDRGKLQNAFGAILTGYARGTRFGIRADADGLLAAGVPGKQLTWMDAKVGDWVVTPRIGKPVEVQALWINALRIAAGFTEEFAGYLRTATESFESRFWNAEAGCLHDVVDVDHALGTVDSRFRPNQIFAVGGLPFALVEGPRARQIVDAVENRLLTPLGLRTLSPDDPEYRGRYAGGVRDRDGAYHQGTAWPWLAGAFVDAWVRVRGGTDEARNEARARFLAPLIAHLDRAGLSHVSEVADGDPPYTPGGCPFQAWSVGETLRIDRVILGDPRAKASGGDRDPRAKASGGDRDPRAKASGGDRETTRPGSSKRARRTR